MVNIFSHQDARSNEINRLCEISNKYTILLIDVVGVMYDGITRFPDAIDAINLAKQCSRPIFISNNPRPSIFSKSKLKGMGVIGDFTVITSGDYTRWFLEKYHQGKTIYHFGAKCNQDILKDLDVSTTDNINQADIILLTQFLEQQDNPDQFDAILHEITQSNKPIFCANPDVYACYGKELRKCAGYFAKKIESFRGSVIYLGKPNPDFYEYVCMIAGLNSDHKSTFLMIGDTVDTDIQGAKNFKIDSLLVLSGISGLLHHNPVDLCTRESKFYMERLC
ncbi:MAG: TIGR01459 family HAD-type hydrolase [Candidatus Paracaedibacteraceae bacterium]|nr:TIGR01459 family HAD-type hydrolase [Candidatus Paracaedibacteraceae bacterium]